MNKKETRVLAKKIRQGLCYNKEEIISKIKPYLVNKHTVGLYYPLDMELDLTFLEGVFKNIRFVYPKIRENSIIFKEKGQVWEKGLFNTYEPTGADVNKKDIDLIITPLLAINARNYRLGYGKGYYDRFLSDFSNDTLAIIKKELLLDFKEDSFDIKIKDVILLWQL